MRHASAVVAAAVFCLAGVFANGSARADVFDFSFGSGVSGTFTTGAAASDPGYELITGLTFDLLSGTYNDGFPFSFTNLVGQDFQPGAAFNPTTDAFINHATGALIVIWGAFSQSTGRRLVLLTVASCKGLFPLWDAWSPPTGPASLKSARP
jgi:hypothetical protein